MRKKNRLIAGSINNVPDDKQFANFVLDASTRPVWDRRLEMAVLPDFVMSIVSMPDFRDGMWDEIRLWHVLEHLSQVEARHAVKELQRILLPEGVLDIEVPDLDLVFGEWVKGKMLKKDLMQWIFSEDLPQMQDAHLNNHRFGYTEETLRALLEEHGFEVGEREKTDDLALRFRAVKHEAISDADLPE